jgi:hypothetical protein
VYNALLPGVKFSLRAIEGWNWTLEGNERWLGNEIDTCLNLRDIGLPELKA